MSTAPSLHIDSVPMGSITGTIVSVELWLRRLVEIPAAALVCTPAVVETPVKA